MTANGRSIVIRWFQEVWNHKRADTIDKLMAPHCLMTFQGAGVPLTRDVFKDYHRDWN